MSLKAKIEAVIYASEEPVTLAQLVSLLSEEAQAELDALAAQQESLPLEDSAVDPDALNAETLGAGSAETAADAPKTAAEDADAAEESAVKEADAAAARAKNQDARRLRDYFRSLLDQLVADYASDER